jgi:hypothetical protein
MSIDAADPAVQKAFEAEVNAGTAAVEAEDLSGDGGVMKTILKEGTSWEKPVNGIEVAGTLHVLTEVHGGRFKLESFTLAL